MAKRTVKKTAKKNTSQRRRKSAKPKVNLDRSRVVAASACICTLCVLLLAVSAFFSARKNSSASVEQTEIVSVPPENYAGPEPSSAGDDLLPQTTSASDRTGQENTSSAKTEKPAPEPQKTQSGSKTQSAPKTETASKTQSSAKTENVSLNNSASSQVSPQSASDSGFPAASGRAVLCIVFDDAGQNISQLKKCLEVPFPVTVAVMPRLAHSAQSAALVRQSGNEVILHQPMQAVNLKVNPGAGAILPEMTGNEIAALLAQNIAEVGPVAGMNNHEGSLITEDEVRMAFVLETIHQRGMYFLDSRTSPATKVPAVSMEMGYSYYQRDIFLDNKKTRENILNELKRGIAVANRQGAVIMIGHVWSAEILPSVLSEVYPELKQKGYIFSTVSKSGAEHK